MNQDKELAQVVLSLESGDGNLKYELNKGMTRHTPFYIASITKLCTHAIIYQLVDKGLQSLGCPIAQLLEANVWQGLRQIKGQDETAKITVTMLLDQSSGLADYETDKLSDGSVIMEQLKKDDFALDDAQTLKLTRQLQAKFEPGTDKAYY